MSQKIRLAPSGPVVFEMGSGARLRLVESETTMGGTVAVPTTASTICTDGFGGTSAVIEQITAPKEKLKYRADLRLDLFNVSSSHNAIVCLFLQSSVDGTTWVTRAKNAHILQPQLGVGTEDNGQAREASLSLVLTEGGSFGVVEGTTTALQFRAQARLVTGSLGDVEVSSLATATETGLNGTIHLSLEECLGDV